MAAKGFFGNWIVKNILRAIALIVILMLIAQLSLCVRTKHNEHVSVPDFSGMPVAEAHNAARIAGVRTVVVDSIYVRHMPKGTVVRQEPKAGAAVKEGRRIQLTINALASKKVPMPNLVGYSLRSAAAELSSRGFELGRLIYVKDMATNNVLRQLYQNREIESGEMIPGEASIDLVLGLSDSDNMAVIPNVTGLKYRRAVELIHESSLNVGQVRFKGKVRTYADSLNSVVYRQSPDAEMNTTVKGRTVSIYLSLE